MNYNEPSSSNSFKNVELIVDEIKDQGNLQAALLAFKDGGIISEVGGNGRDINQFSAMCASVLKSAEGLGQTFGEENVGKIITELENQSIMIVKCSEKMYLVLFFKLDTKVDFITKNLDDYIQKIITALQ
jgi:predicted regulator of Ras-like GTPase activity (Roadblock/LC7/MglB family)